MKDGLCWITAVIVALVAIFCWVMSGDERARAAWAAKHHCVEIARHAKSAAAVAPSGDVGGTTITTTYVYRCDGGQIVIR